MKFLIFISSFKSPSLYTKTFQSSMFFLSITWVPLNLSHFPWCSNFVFIKLILKGLVEVAIGEVHGSILSSGMGDGGSFRSSTCLEVHLVLHPICHWTENSNFAPWGEALIYKEYVISTYVWCMDGFEALLFHLSPVSHQEPVLVGIFSFLEFTNARNSF